MGVLTLVPLPYRWLMLAVIAAGLFFFGYVKGLRVGELKLDVFTAQQAALAAKADAANARLAANQKGITANVSQDYETRLAVLRARYASLQHASAGAHGVPAVSVAAIKPDAAGSELGAACDQRESPWDGPLEERAAEDALTLTLLQGWVRRQQAVSNGQAASAGDIPERSPDEQGALAGVTTGR
jgi:hypothetical protein